MPTYTTAQIVALEGVILASCGGCRLLRQVPLFKVPAHLRHRDLRSFPWKCRTCGETADLVIVEGKVGFGGERPELDRFVPSAERPPE